MKKETWQKEGKQKYSVWTDNWIHWKQHISAGSWWNYLWKSKNIAPPNKINTFSRTENICQATSCKLAKRTSILFGKQILVGWQEVFAGFSKVLDFNLNNMLRCSFRNRLRQYPALVNCTTIDWFSEWPSDALLEVAERYLEKIQLSNDEVYF